MIDFKSLKDLVRDTLGSRKNRDQIEEVVQELEVGELAGELDLNKLTEAGWRRRICRMARSFRVSSVPLTGAEFKASSNPRDEDDAEMVRRWKLVQNTFSLDGTEKMLVATRRGDTDQRALAAATGMSIRTLRNRFNEIRRDAMQ